MLVELDPDDDRRTHAEPPAVISHPEDDFAVSVPVAEVVATVLDPDTADGALPASPKSLSGRNTRVAVRLTAL